MELNLIATQGRIIVKALPDEETNVGGILLANPQNKDLHFGVVKSVGEPGEKTKQVFEVGQTVVWSQYSGIHYQFDGNDFVILKYEDIISIKVED